MNGETHQLEVDSSKILLDAFQKSGIDAPFSCKGAVCCTCKAKVLEGKAEMKMNLSLTDGEVADGYILTCQSLAVSEDVTISFDE